jgi:hypothetical protein
MHGFLLSLLKVLDDPTLEDATEAVNRVGVHRATVLLLTVIDGDVWKCLAEIAIAGPLVRTSLRLVYGFEERSGKMGKPIAISSA